GSRAEALIGGCLEQGAPPTHERHARTWKAWLALWRGDVAAAATMLDELKSMGTRRVVLPQDRHLVARLVVDVAMAQDDPDQAWNEVVAAIGPTGEEARAAGYDLPLMATAAQALGARHRRAAGPGGGPDDMLEAEGALVRRPTGPMSV